MEPLTLILSSSVVAAVVSGLVSSGMSVYTQRRGFAHEYYRQVLNRRLAACEAVEVVLNMFKLTVPVDKGMCHLPLVGHKPCQDANAAISRAFAQSLWLSPEAKTQLLEFQRLVGRVQQEGAGSDEEITEAGARAYMEIATQRDKLEGALVSDLPDLHKVDKWLGRKEVTTGFGLFDSRSWRYVPPKDS
jgi:hypothetical protein